MTVCEQFSQRSTCPPSAAVRQRSMADITFNWSRLTCPAFAANSPRSLLAPPTLLARPRQQVERALDGGDHAGGDAHVAGGGVQFVVPEQRLDLSDIGSAIEQVGGE